MDKALKAFKAILVIPAILAGLFLIYSFFSKFTGVSGFAARFFEFFLGTVFYFLFFLIAAVLGITTKTAIYKRVLFLLLVFVMASIFVITQSPQGKVTRFYDEIQNHKLLNNLKASDVSFIAVEDIFLTQSEQIRPIVTALNSSTWYVGRRGECIGKEVQMVLVLQTRQVVHLQIGQFCGEDAAMLLFVQPLASGFASGGEMYVPKLPSVLKTQGYELLSDD